MSIISLSTYVDMSGAATPSTGIIMGLDLDGTLKQKGTSGAVTEIGSGGGGSGSSGSSGTSGSSGSSGTSGVTGASGIDGGNTIRWIYGDRGVSGEFEMGTPNFTLASNQIYINYFSQIGDSSPWLSALSDYITLFPGGAYLKISDLSDSTKYAIYQINSALDQTVYWFYDCSKISGNSNPTAGLEYSISWIIMGGNNGSSGTSGSNGSSGYSGIDGANTLRWELDATSAGSIKKFKVDNLLTSGITEIVINKTSMNSSASNWLDVIDTKTTANPNSVYLQIAQSNDSSVFGIYLIESSIDNSPATNTYTFTVNPMGGVISSNGTLTSGEEHSISFNTPVGSSGTSGSSGSSGSSGTSGSSGSSGLSGGIFVNAPISGPSGTITALPSPSIQPEYWPIDTTSSAVSVSLSTAATVADGKIIYIKDEGGNATSNNITITAHLAETIDGQNTRGITSSYGAVTLIKNGAGSWFVLSSVSNIAG